MAPTETAHIWLDDRGVAWIDETNVKVVEVALDTLAYGSTPKELHEQYPHLSMGQIHAALSYYHDHQAQFDAAIERDNHEIAGLQARAGESPFRKRMRAEGRLR